MMFKTMPNPMSKDKTNQTSCLSILILSLSLLFHHFSPLYLFMSKKREREALLTQKVRWERSTGVQRGCARVQWA